MATTLYFRRANVHASPIQRCSAVDNPAGLDGLSGWKQRSLSTSRGASATSETANTVNGPTNGRLFGSNGSEWMSDPVDADVTISGTITLNLRALESNMSANAAINAAIYKLAAADLTTTLILKTARVTELGLTEAAANFTGTPTSTALAKGDRLIIVPFIDDAGTMASTYTCTFYYDGPTGGASGDSYVTFTETFGFITATPAGTTMYPTTTDTGLATADAALEMWTSRGAAAIGPTHARYTNSAPVAAPGLQFGERECSANATGGGVLAETGLRDPLDRSAQSFIWREGIEITSVRAYLLKTGSPSDNLIVEIQGDASGSPDGSVVGSKTVSAASITGSAKNTITFDTPVALTPGTTYWVVFRRSGTTDNSNYLQTVGSPATGTFNDGLAKYSDDGGSAWNTGTNPVDLGVALLGAALVWYSKPLQAFTLSGLVTVGLWGLGTGGGNHSARAEIAVVNQDGSSPTVFGQAGYWESLAEGEFVPATGAAPVRVCGDDISVADGQRIRLRVWAETPGDNDGYGGDSGGQQVGSRIYWNGPTGGASGDMFVTLTQSVSEYAPGTAIPPDLLTARHTPRRRLHQRT